MNTMAVVVLSCDKYASLWHLFFSRLSRYWPDCPYPVYLVSNFEEYCGPDVTTLCTGVDLDWSSNLLSALERITAEEVLLMMDDAPLDATVDTALFMHLHDRYRRERMNYLNLKGDPRPDRVTDEEIGEIVPGSLYRTALVPAMWRICTLKSLLQQGETAWQFEVNGSTRSDGVGRFFSTRRAFFKCIHCVIRGKLDLRAARSLAAHGELRAIGFPLMSRREYAIVRVRELRGLILRTVVPSGMRRKLRAAYYKTFLGSRVV